MANREYAPLRLEDLMPFGKFKGKAIKDLVENEASYLQWLIDEAGTSFDSGVLQALDDASMES